MRTVVVFVVVFVMISASMISIGRSSNLYNINKKNNQISLYAHSVERYAPTLCYDYKEKYFPVDVHGDDDNVLNNHENYDRGLFPSIPVCYYNVVSYNNFKVYEYWFYYAYNDYNYYSIKINDIHEHDFESVFVWVNSDGNPFYVVTSMHLWMQRYDYHGENHPFVYVERGGHGMSLNKKLIDGIPMVFEKPGRTISWSEFSFRDFSELKNFAKFDLDKNGYYKTDENSKVHVKAPWLRKIFSDPDIVRKSRDVPRVYHSSHTPDSRDIHRVTIVERIITPHFSFLRSTSHRLVLRRFLLHLNLPWIVSLV